MKKINFEDIREQHSADDRRTWEVKTSILEEGYNSNYPVFLAEFQSGEDTMYAILDGNHRVEALRQLNMINEGTYMVIDWDTFDSICEETNESSYISDEAYEKLIEVSEEVEVEI